MTLSMSSVTGNAERRHTTHNLFLPSHSAMQPNARIDRRAIFFNDESRAIASPVQ
jgi:hypothetical protein